MRAPKKLVFRSGVFSTKRGDCQPTSHLEPQGSRGVHRYSLEGTGLDAKREAARFRFYRAHYGIPLE